MSTIHILSLVALGACMMTPQAHAEGPVFYTNATFITLDPGQPRAEAMLVEGDRIKRLYTRAPGERPRGARLVDLAGAVVVPGLADAHLHLSGIGGEAREVDLKGTTSVEQAVARVRTFVDKYPGDAPVVGFGWDQSRWQPKRFPERAALDRAFGDRVILLYRIDGHAAWASSAALRLAGVTKTTTDPEGGRIIKDKQGEPTGVLLDNAIELVRSNLPPVTREMVQQDLKAGAARCAELGLTSVHDMGITIDALHALRALERSGELKVRVFAYLVGDDPRSFKELQARPRRSAGLIEVRGIKLYADGALGSRGAALKQPYSDEPKNSGLLVTEPKVLKEKVRQVHQRGYQVAIHAIGDRGNRVAIDAIAALGQEASTRRHRIEHAQILDPADLEAFFKLGIIASMQPTHATSDMRWAEARLGTKRLAGAYAWNSLLKSGAHLAFGSDAPVESPDPRWGLFAAVHRTDHDGRPRGGWLPAERLDRTTALEAFTAGPAYAVDRESELGRLRADHLADFTVLSQDPRADSTRLLKLEVKRTVVAGREVFRAR